jgi:hypothetical protein
VIFNAFSRACPTFALGIPLGQEAQVAERREEAPHGEYG